jgi:hypothetical protein
MPKWLHGLRERGTGMKYIIDIPKEYESDWVNKSSRLGFELCFPINETATNKKYHIPTGLKLESYTEPDREAIENEVWEFASMLMNMHPDVAKDIYWSMNGGKGIGVAAEMTYQEAKSKYEVWKKQKEDEATMKEVTALAEKIGIHKLYSMVKEIRGE